MSQVNLSEILALLPPDKQDNARCWAAYSLTWLPLTASTSNIQAKTTTQDDSLFIATRIKAYATTNASPPVETTAPQATLILRIGANDLFPDATPIHVGMFVDNATKEGGQELEFPTVVPAVTSLVGFASNLTATDIMLRVVFFGLRVFQWNKGQNQL